MNHLSKLGASPTGQLLINFNAFNDPLYRAADLECITTSLPELYPEQQLDVLKAEKRFQEGKGILFTNGTGTGKTFVGLGISKRFCQQSKNSILIVVPTDKKAKDWILEGSILELNIRQLESVCDIKSGIIVTTYSNFYQNTKLANAHFDLVIYDECHYLLQNASGNFTEALIKHRDVGNLPSAFITKYDDQLRDNATEYNEEYNKFIFNRDTYEKLYNRQIKEFISKTKVVFLSASPFAYHKSIMLGDGCLWNIHEKEEVKEEDYMGYNESGNYENFFIENFGYKMRYNRLTIPDHQVNVGLMERNFHEKFAEEGIISSRQIQVDKDYSREFIIVNSNIGKRIDQGKELFHSSEFRDNYKYLMKYVDRKFNYNYTNQLLECIKAKEVVDRIREHLKLDRKIIIFHNYNNSLPSHPFRFEANKLIKKEVEYSDMSGLISDIEKFEEEFPELVNLDLSDLANPRQTINNAFPELKEFNGTISKKKRAQYLEDFNKDNSNTTILMVQTKAGKEGISLHDKTGNKPRVLITLGLPTAPTDAIQIEGRTYRIGLKSNAIYEYITLQTNFECIAFADKIATRSRTAENLAMGEKARNLEIVFKEGYLNANQEPPSLEQGRGGKESDQKFEIISKFDKAKTYYFGLGKKSSKNKSREGTDYFATPEPLGYKMVEWLGLEPGQRVLEPSAGHGAIGRFFPENTDNTFIEESYQLSSKLSINVKGNIKTMRFEDYKKWNKFDGIVMNPPFGRAGKLAMEHIAKAATHLFYTKGPKIIAIVPNSTSMDKRLESFLAIKDNFEIQIITEILLPSVVFERAGTNIFTKIIILENNSQKTSRNVIDLTHINDINEFFNYIEHLHIS